MNKGKIYIRDGRAPVPDNELVSRIMSSIKGKNTKPELEFRKALWRKNLRGYRIHSKKVPGSPDIIYSKIKLAIFINGCFWHRCPHCFPPIPKSHTDFWLQKFQMNIERDKIKITQLEDAGWITMTVWECQIKQNIDVYIDKVNTYFRTLKIFKM